MHNAEMHSQITVPAFLLRLQSTPWLHPLQPEGKQIIHQIKGNISMDYTCVSHTKDATYSRSNGCRAGSELKARR